MRENSYFTTFFSGEEELILFNVISRKYLYLIHFLYLKKMFSVVISVNSQPLLMIQFYKKIPRIFGFFEKKIGENFQECMYILHIITHFVKLYKILKLFLLLTTNAQLRDSLHIHYAA